MKMETLADIEITDITKVIQYNLNFLNHSLLEENLSENVDLERKELITLLENLIEKLENADSKKTTMRENRSFSFKKMLGGTASTKRGKIQEDYKVKDAKTNKSIEAGLDALETKDGIYLSKTVKESENYEAPVDADSHISKENSSKSLPPSLSLETIVKKLKYNQGVSPNDLKESAVLTGYLTKHKKKHFMASIWHRRYCILTNEFLFYFKNESDEKEKGFIILPSYKIGIPAKEKNLTITLDPNDKGTAIYTFQADTKEDYEQWKFHLNNVMNMILTEEQTALLERLKDVAESNADDVNDGDNIKNEDNDNRGLMDTATIASSQSSASSVEENLKAVNETSKVTFSEENVYIGLHDCYGEDADDLSFKRGDVLYILDRIDTAWSIAYANGKCGLVPNNFLTEAFE